MVWPIFRAFTGSRGNWCSMTPGDMIRSADKRKTGDWQKNKQANQSDETRAHTDVCALQQAGYRTSLMTWTLHLLGSLPGTSTVHTLHGWGRQYAITAGHRSTTPTIDSDPIKQNLGEWSGWNTVDPVADPSYNNRPTDSQLAATAACTFTQWLSLPSYIMMPICRTYFICTEFEQLWILWSI